MTCSMFRASPRARSSCGQNAWRLLRRAECGRRSGLPAIAVAQHSLEVSIPDAPIWLSVDAARVSQAVTNLLNNSAKYTPKGGRIRLVATADEGHAVIRVLDNGVGIAADNLPAVFEMFHQGSGGRRSQGGLGVGLALTKRLVELQGGTVEAHSAGEKKGAEFMIRLPLAVTARPAVQRQAPAPSGTRKCLRVLVVDDNVDFVDILALVLETDGAPGTQGVRRPKRGVGGAGVPAARHPVGCRHARHERHGGREPTAPARGVGRCAYRRVDRMGSGRRPAPNRGSWVRRAPDEAGRPTTESSGSSTRWRRA